MESRTIVRELARINITFIGEEVGGALVQIYCTRRHLRAECLDLGDACLIICDSDPLARGQRGIGEEVII